jgi:hypothetical protein
LKTIKERLNGYPDEHNQVAKIKMQIEKLKNKIDKVKGGETKNMSCRSA